MEEQEHLWAQFVERRENGREDQMVTQSSQGLRFSTQHLTLLGLGLVLGLTVSSVQCADRRPGRGKA